MPTTTDTRRTVHLLALMKKGDKPPSGLDLML